MDSHHSMHLQAYLDSSVGSSAVALFAAQSDSYTPKQSGGSPPARKWYPTRRPCGVAINSLVDLIIGSGIPNFWGLIQAHPEELHCHPDGLTLAQRLHYTCPKSC